MARLIHIRSDERRTTVHDVEGVGTSARKKHNAGALTSPQEFFAVRLLKDETGSEYYVELSRAEAAAVLRDFKVYLE